VGVQCRVKGHSGYKKKAAPEAAFCFR